MADAITDRLDRILYVLALAVRTGGVTLDELARALDCPAADVLRDLQEVTAREFYQRPGATNQLQIRIEGDHIEVWTPAEFHQPVRLSPREGLALGLGLRILAAESNAERRASILALASRLEHELVTQMEEVSAREPSAPVYGRRTRLHEAAASPGEETTLGDDQISRVVSPTPARAVPEPVFIDAGDDGFRSDLADAAVRHERCRVLYLKPGDAAPAWRDVAPYLLVHASGAWYILGHDKGRDDVRVFRMDRVLRVEPTGETFDPPADFDAAAFVQTGRGVYRAPVHETEVTVRYSARIARWIEERTPCDRQSDGSVVVHHRVADPQWIIRHVLQYGADAQVMAPADVRARIATAAIRLTA